MKNFILFCALVVSLSGCTQIKGFFGSKSEVPPEEVVKKFIEVSASAKNDSDRSRLQDLCSGEMRRAFERMTTEAFRISYLNNNVHIGEVKILEKSTTGDNAKVHYQVSVDNKQGTDATQEVNEREVELVKSQGNWYIEAIRLHGSDKIAFTRGMIF